MQSNNLSNISTKKFANNITASAKLYFLPAVERVEVLNGEKGRVAFEFIFGMFF